MQEALDDIIMKDKMTVLTVAHRLSTIRNCDLIIVMDQGQVLDCIGPPRVSSAVPPPPLPPLFSPQQQCRPVDSHPLS